MGWSEEDEYQEQKIRERERDAHIDGLKEALDIIYEFAGKGQGQYQIDNVGPIWSAINARIAELEKDHG